MRASIPFTLAVLLPVASLAARQEGDPVREQLLVDQAALRVEHAEADVEHAQQILVWASRMPPGEEVGQLVFMNGRRSDADSYRSVASEIERCEAAQVEAERELAVQQLDLEEMRITRRRPRRGWSVPLVEGRDIEGDRMRARLESLQFTASSLANRHASMQQLVNMRAIPWREQAAAADAVEAAQERVTALQRELDMRELKLAAKLPADARFILQDESLARRRQLLEARLERARVHVAELRPLTGRGIASQLDLDRAEASERELMQALAILQTERVIFEHEYRLWEDAQAARGSR